MPKKKKSLVGWIEDANFDNLERIYKGWHKVNGITFISKCKKVWYQPIKVRITIEHLPNRRKR